MRRYRYTESHSISRCRTAPPAGTLDGPRHAGAGLAPFSTDGCSRFPDCSLGGKTDWCGCCVAHDLACWRGGTDRERLDADRALRSCVSAASHSLLLSRFMYAGVRLACGPYLPTSFRWGYGWPYGREYQPLDVRDEAQAASLRDAYLSRNPTLACTLNAH